MNAREIKLHRKAQDFRGAAPDALLLQQMKAVEPMLDRTIDPRKHLNLDGTKLALHRERVEAWRRGEFVAPITIDMALTQRCSYSCTFCYAGLQQNPQAPVEWPVYERFLEEAAELGVKAISLVSDGESTENPDFVKFVMKAKAVGLDVAVGTNGLRLDQFGVTGMEALLDSLTYLRFNFNAAHPARYAEIMGTSEKNYHKVVGTIKMMTAMKRARGNECTIGLQQVLMPEYADEVLPLALLSRSLGADYLVIKHCSDDENGRLGVDYDWYKSEIAERLFDTAEALSQRQGCIIQAKKTKFKTGRDRRYSRCYGTPLLLQISGSGVVAPCGSFFHSRYANRHIGDLKTSSLRSILESDRYRKIINTLASNSFDPRKECATLCLQDKVNEALFDLIHYDTELPPAIDNAHRNFV